MKCESCGVGRYQQASASYLYPLNGRMLIVPNAPLYICDMCRRTRYATYFVESMTFLLSRLENRSSRPYRRRQALLNQSDTWHPSRGNQ